MKAAEVLRRYANGERDFHCADLRGQDFELANLLGANFSRADMRGANFRELSAIAQFFSL